MANLSESIKTDQKKRTIWGLIPGFEFVGIEITTTDSATTTLANNATVTVSQEVGFPGSGTPSDRYFATPQVSVYQDSVSAANRIPDGDNIAGGDSTTVGETGVGGTTATIEDIIRGTKFTTGKGGSVRSISVYLNVSTTAHKVRCALYEYLADGNAGSLLSQTEEKTISPSTGWQTFNFSAPHFRLKRNTTYYLVAWAEATTGNCLMYFDLIANDGVFNNTLSYGTFPNPMTGESSSSGHFSIYCTYVPDKDYRLLHWVDWGSTDTRNWEISFKTTIINNSGSQQTILYRGNIRRVIKGD